MGNSRHTQEDSQTFVMNYVIKKYDETKYRCTARNESGYEISHTMDLVIRGQYRRGHTCPALTPVDTCRNNNVIITSKRHDVVLA